MPRVGRKPKKRRLADHVQGLEESGLRALDLNLDLNVCFDLNLDEGFDLNEELVETSDVEGAGTDKNLFKRECIDLNLDLNGEAEAEREKETDALKVDGGDCATPKKIEREFDLNLELVEEVKAEDVADIPKEKEEEIFCTGNAEERGSGNAGLVDVRVCNDGSCIGFGMGDGDVLAATCVSVEILHDDTNVVTSGIRGRGRPRGRRKSTENLAQCGTIVLGVDVHPNELGNCGDEKSGTGRRMRRDSGNQNEDVATHKLNVGTNDNEENPVHNGSVYTEVTVGRRKGRKRNRIDDTISTPETVVLRRSTRRSLTTASTALSALTESSATKSCRQLPDGASVGPPKVVLPPSSKHPDLSDLPIIDVFSVYACLRSFSMLLFLSPFRFEEFVESLKFDFPNLLFDSIHVAILQTLKRHLDYLSAEGSVSASDCLRSLNWDFLDEITWPIYVVEYFIIHRSSSKLEFDLCRLNLLRNDYHKLSASVKVEILRCLCDDMIEVEAVRSELNKRSLSSECEADFDRHAYMNTLQRKRSEMDFSGASCLTVELVEPTVDGNSDECCLCKMDGRLICCDGCPAAYHSKCVGITNESLPDGEWYCPECVIDKQTTSIKGQNALRGGELLGVDLCGQMYFISYGFLLVSSINGDEDSFSYYNRLDLLGVVEVLKSSVLHYGGILEAICKYFSLPLPILGDTDNLNSHEYKSQLEFSVSEIGTVNNVLNQDKRCVEENSVIGLSFQLDVEVSKAVSPTCPSSEGSAESDQMACESLEAHKSLKDYSSQSCANGDQSENLWRYPYCGDNCLTLLQSNEGVNTLDVFASNGGSVAFKTVHIGPKRVYTGHTYTNYYSFARIAALIVEDMTRKVADKSVENVFQSDEQIIYYQMKIISKRFLGFFWPTLLSLCTQVHKEKCGWCFCCRTAIGSPDCLFNLRSGFSKGSSCVATNILSDCNSNGHLHDVIRTILLFECRLQGLLQGPWLDPNYSSAWRKRIIKASELKTVKSFLLSLELNLYSRALSSEWWANSDSSLTMGSMFLDFVNSSHAPGKSCSKKRVKISKSESTPSLNSNGGLVMFWWRGGRISRQLFSWKLLPHSLVLKSARKGGCLKLPGVFYLDNADGGKRSKAVAWRAAVESAVSVKQLAYQIRDLEFNIKWDEIENIKALSILDKEFKKSFSQFKRAIIRRKRKDGDSMKYLLDFGKRKSIPDIVLKHGFCVKDPLSEKKKYWLNKSYVPLHLLKHFEERRIARRVSSTNSGQLLEEDRIRLQKKGWNYLFAKAEMSEYQKCGHCHKNVLIREAVCCQYCKESFHRRHVQKSGGSIAAKCFFTCHRCNGDRLFRTNSRKRKKISESGETGRKNAKHVPQKVACRRKETTFIFQKSDIVTPLRKSARLGSKRVSLASRSKRMIKKKKLNSRKSSTAFFRANSLGTARNESKSNITRTIPSRQPRLLRKTRSLAYHSYWLNGLFLSKRSDDERANQFRSKRMRGPSENISSEQPKCHLCGQIEYLSSRHFISCEICGDWFHADAFGLSQTNIDKLIGFRCHVCRKRDSPICQSRTVTQ